jgi:hypothetical protein
VSNANNFVARKFRVGARVQGFASKPTGAFGTVRSILKQSKTAYRVDWDNGGSSVCSPLSLTSADDGPQFAPDSKEWSGPPSAPYARRYSGFRCYYRSATGRLVPHRSGGHYYGNGMYASRDEAQVAAEQQAVELRAADPDKRWQAYEV